MERRSFLSRSFFAAGATAIGGGGAAACRAEPGRPTVSTADPSRGAHDVTAMADAVLAADREDVAELAMAWVRDGATFRDLLGAAYLAGLREINPSPIGGQVHALMMVASAAEASASLRGRAKLLPALFNLDRVKRSQARDAGSGRGDWIMKPAPDVPTDASVDEHSAALATAMRTWNEDAGDRAVVALHDALPIDAFFEHLWPWAARDFRVIGHKIIFAVQSYRALQEVGWRHGRDAVRSVALGVLDGNPYDAHDDDESKAILALFDDNLERARRFPSTWRQDANGDATAVDLYRALSSAGGDPIASADAVVAHLERGAGEQCAWDGIRLVAFEQTMQMPSIAGVHTVTSVNALHRAAQLTAIESTRRLCVLQAASWLALFRPLLRDRARSNRDHAILELSARSTADGDPFGGASFVDRAERASAAFAAGRGDRFRGRALEVLARKAQHDHDYKYTVAVVEEIRAADPAVRPALAAAAMGMLRHDGSDDGAVYRAFRSRQG